MHQSTGIYHLDGEVRKLGAAIRIVNEIAEALGLTRVRNAAYVFPRRPGRPAKEPLGITAIAILKESCISLSTYPEDRAAVVTLCVCRPKDTQVILPVFARHHLAVSTEFPPAWIQ